MEEKTLDALYYEDLPKFLKSVGQLETFESGAVFCCICGTSVTTETVQLIVPLAEKEFRFVCKLPDCVSQYYEQGGCH